jgi:hypothetical protein
VSDESLALILDVLRANQLHQSECAYRLARSNASGFAADEQFWPACDCWLSEAPPGERGWWSSRDLSEMAGDPADEVRVTTYSNIAGASRQYVWPDGRVRSFRKNRGDKGWTEVTDA